MCHVSFHFGLHGAHELIEHRAGSFDNQQHASIAQIFDKSVNVEPRRDRPRRVTKPDALHSPGKTNLPPLVRFVRFSHARPRRAYVQPKTPAGKLSV